MESNAIYEKNFLEDCLGELKQLRLQWSSGQWYEGRHSRRLDNPTSMCSLGGADYEHYSFIMRESSECVYQAICKTILDLASEYGLECKHLVCQRREAYQYVDDNDDGPVAGLDRKRAVHILCIENDGGKSVFVIKEFGIGEQLPPDFEKYLKGSCRASSLTYVSLVEGDADKEDLGHRGNIIDVGKFLRDQFGAEEEACFFDYFEQLKARANDVFGLKVTKTLQYMELGGFRADLLKNVRERSYPINVMGKALTDGQRAVIEKHYLEERRCRATVGGTDFATSFITAEWLYSSLRGAANVDLTPVALGYFKALEQFLDKLIEALTFSEADGARSISLDSKNKKNKKLYWKVDGITDYSRWIPVEDGAVAVSPKLFAEGFRYALNLGRLAGFFGSWDKRENTLVPENKDLPNSGIEDGTYEAIILTLQSLREMRNGYLHKDNLYEWAEVDKVRDELYTVFYLMLGSYRLDERAIAHLDVLGPKCSKGFDRLCVYIDQASREKLDPPGIPVFYFGQDAHPGDFYLACPADGDPVIDRFGRVVSHPGACFRRAWSKTSYDFKITVENAPSIIREGRLLFGKDDSGVIKFDLTGAEKTIFEKGEFLE